MAANSLYIHAGIHQTRKTSVSKTFSEWQQIIDPKWCQTPQHHRHRPKVSAIWVRNGHENNDKMTKVANMVSTSRPPDFKREPFTTISCTIYRPYRPLLLGSRIERSIQELQKKLRAVADQANSAGWKDKEFDVPRLLFSCPASPPSFDSLRAYEGPPLFGGAVR